jgi:hypothetical protein
MALSKPPHCGMRTYLVEGTRPTPAAESLFTLGEDVPLVTEQERSWFRTFVAKLLYLAKRVRPECLTAQGSGRRVLKYLRGDPDRGLVLEIGGDMVVNTYIDAAYGVHTKSGRSHTGACVVIGKGGPCASKSAKQKIVTKSSTEAELVGLSDSAGLGMGYGRWLPARNLRPTVSLRECCFDVSTAA